MALKIGNMPLFSFLLKSILVCTISINYDASAAAVKGDHQNVIGGQQLYNSSDHVIILNATNFKSNVYGDKKAWLVEFYNSWCGFCYRFAPIWKALANDIYSWRDIVVVAAIDCADDDNGPLCREYEIMLYPLIKYFSVNARYSSLGIGVEKGDNVDTVRHNLINRLYQEQQEGRGLTWPNITPYRNVEITDVWKALPSMVKCFVLFFEKPDSHLGTELILDMHKIKSLHIRRVTSDNELLCVTNKVTKFPSLIAFSHDDSGKFLNIKVSTRENVAQVIKDFMKSKGIGTEEKMIITHSEKMTDIIIKSTNMTENVHVINEEPMIAGDYLFQIDLENALKYSMDHEISLTKNIKGGKMAALKLYINVLATYFPLRHKSTFFDVIRQTLEKKDWISGEEFNQMINSVQTEIPIYSKQHQWIACKGSTYIYRGYPCGLWTMFHMLTVNFAVQNEDSLEYDSTLVLRAMLGYVKHFFGCADCSNHFVEMASKMNILKVHNGDENILWLWKAHNKVNARLAGDVAEDPEHKKIQYPSPEHCMACKYENGTWNEAQILLYLKKKYSYGGINYYGSNSEDSREMINKRNIKEEKAILPKYVSSKKFGWDFTIFDISICVLLYILSAAILILVCIKFAVKRTYRKKVYVNLLGKV